MFKEVHEVKQLVTTRAIQTVTPRFLSLHESTYAISLTNEREHHRSDVGVLNQFLGFLFTTTGSYSSISTHTHTRTVAVVTVTVTEV
jgi:hypothetical protein